MTLGQVPGPTLETTRNRLLRRVDWRVLLPVPWPERASCFARGELADAVSLISGSTRENNKAGDGDLAVVFEPDRQTLSAALVGLRPGGSIYAEWRAWRWLMMPFLARRKLTEAGLVDIQLFRVQFGSETCTPEQWIPLASPGARSRGRAYMRGSDSRIRGLVRTVLRGVWPLGSGLRSPSRLCAIARRPGLASDSGGEGASEPQSLASLVRDSWEGWGLGNAPSRISFLLLTSGQRSVNKLVALAFCDNEREPSIVLKIPRVPDSVPGLEREAETLRMLEARQGGIRGIPRVLFQEVLNGLPVLGQTVAVGRRLHELLDDEAVHGLVADTTRWQMELASHRTSWTTAALRQRLLDPVQEDFLRCFGSVADERMLREADDALSGMSELPQICEHRDFSPWNILVAGDGSLTVLDWESSDPSGVPATDLVYLFTYVAVYLRDGFASDRYEDCYLETLDSSTRIGEASQAALEGYSRELGLCDQDLRALRIFTWMVHSRSAYQHLLADTGGRGPADEALRRAPFFRLWETEMRNGDRY